MPNRTQVLRPRSGNVALMVMLSALTISSFFSNWVDAQEHEQERETSRLLAILFDSGRVVVGMNQDLINDASKGDKGFTSAVFEKQVLTVFEKRTGINLSNSSDKVPAMARPLLDRLLQESKKTIDS